MSSVLWQPIVPYAACAEKKVIRIQFRVRFLLFLASNRAVPFLMLKSLVMMAGTGRKERKERRKEKEKERKGEGMGRRN